MRADMTGRLPAARSTRSRRLRAGAALLTYAVTAGAAAARAQEQGFAFQPEAASTIAPQSDLLFDVILLLTSLISAGVCLTIVVFCFKYRRGHKADRTNPPRENLTLEITWTAIPTVLSLGVFVWGARVYYDMYRDPPGAMTVYVVGKQWMWHLQHPEGRREIDELHVPVGRPVRLVLTSQDVIHDFYVPAFRMKQDALPGRYTTEWFTATKPGRYRFFCAQYCGTQHSLMAGWVVVMPPSDYAAWLSSGSPQKSMVAEGENLFQQYGCSGCHGPASTVHAPSLVGIYGKPVPLQGRTWATADDRYLHDSIVLPQNEIADGYPNVMPSYSGKLTEEQITQIVAYLRSLANQPMDNLRPPTDPATQNGRGTGAAPRAVQAVEQASATARSSGAAAGATIRRRAADAATRKGNE